MIEQKRRGRPPKQIVDLVEPSAQVLAGIVDEFKARFPDEWETLRLCPLQHGLEDMIARL